GLRPFPECRQMPSHFGGACANCKWRDHGARCRFPRPPSSPSVMSLYPWYKHSS
ncbi:hypothetical protein EV356DRAFT_457712, partial [Viridothelium virens]